MRTILIPVDFSEASINALRYGISLASYHSSRVLLMHVYKLDMAGGYSLPYIRNEIVEKTEEKVLGQLKELTANVNPTILSRVSIEYFVGHGHTVEEVINVSRVFHVDHIIIGMRGEHHMLRKILGGTALSLVSQSPKPILLIPENHFYRPIKQIAYATNFEEEDPRIIDQLLKLAKPLAAKVHCIHIRERNEKQDLFKQKILRKAFEGDVPVEDIAFSTIAYNKVVEGLNHFVQEREVDVLAMLTHKRSIFNRLFHKSQTRHMAIESQVPLWAFSLHSPNG
ncbi:MAG: universal stress protein [Bacteroidota bacterium]